MFKKYKTHGILLVVLLSVFLSGCFGFLTPAPSVQISGVANDVVYYEAVTPEINAGKKTNISSITLSKDGADPVEFESGTTIEEAGKYKLVVVADTGKDNDTVTTIEFEIVFITISISGIEEGVIYTELTPVVTSSGADKVEAKLNGEVIDLEQPITKPGRHTLEVTATAGTASRTESASFIIASELFVFNHDDMVGVWHDKGKKDHTPVLNTDPDFIKIGENSIKFTNQPGTKSALRINRDPKTHVWPVDWTIYTHTSMWVYIEDVSVVNNLEYDLGIGNERVQTSWPGESLTNGWNLLEINLKDLAGEHWDQLDNMYYSPDNNGKYNTFLDFIVRTPTEEIDVYFNYITWYSLD